jgi:hypothetical protein
MNAMLNTIPERKGAKNMSSHMQSCASVPIKQRVLKFARLLFSERGLRGTHVRYICSHTGVNVLLQVFLRLGGPLPAWEILTQHVASTSLKALQCGNRKQACHERNSA